MTIGIPSSAGRNSLALPFLDCCWLVLAPILSLWLRQPSLIRDNVRGFIINSTIEYLVVSFAISFILYLLFRINRSLLHLFSSKDVFSILIFSITSSMVTVGVIFTISRMDGIPRTVPIIYAVVLASGLLAGRVGLSGLYEKKSFRNLDNCSPIIDNKIRLLIIGIDVFSIRAIRLLQFQFPSRFEVVGIINSERKYIGRSVSGLKIAGSMTDIKAIIEEYKVHGVEIDEVWVSDHPDTFRFVSYDFLLEECSQIPINLMTISRALGIDRFQSLNIQNDIKSINNPDDIITIHGNNIKSYLFIKRLLDVIISLTMLIIASPVCGIVCIMVSMDVGNPLLFWQERIGKNGKRFRLYKFRTMKLPLDEFGNVIEEQKRISRIGRIFRQFRIDELPQLINILVGEMSGIGPRPLLMKDQPNVMATRLSMRPGITGWAQVNGGELISPDEKNALDSWYVANCSFFLDFYIVLLTIKLLINGVSRNERAINEALKWYNEIKSHNLIK